MNENSNLQPAASAPAPAAAPQSLGDIFDRDFNAPVQVPDSSPAITDTQVTEPPIETEPQAAPPQEPVPPQKIMGKYETVVDLENAHKSLQSAYTKEHMAAIEAQKQIDALKAELESRNNPPQPDPIEGLDGQELTDMLFERPREILESLIQKAITKAIDPLAQKTNSVAETIQKQEQAKAWNQTVTDFYNRHADAAEIGEQMKEYIVQNNLMQGNPLDALKTAYAAAKGHDSYENLLLASFNAPKPQPPTLDEMLKDPNNLQKVLSNPELSALFAKNHIAATRTAQQQVPPTITGNSGGNAPTMPLAKPKSIKEAIAMAADRFY